jgi:hypothetical protein
MPTPDASELIRLLCGESVFGRDTDSKILQASNEMSGRMMFEMFARCDTSREGWAQEYADGLLEPAAGDPLVLVGFDDGRWQGGDCWVVGRVARCFVEFRLVRCGGFALVLGGGCR